MNRKARFLGRPVQPLAWALVIASFTLFLTSLVHMGSEPTAPTVFGDLLGAAALSVSVVFVLGWALNTARLTRVGYLMACGVFLARVVLLGLMQGWGFYGVWMSLAWAVAAGGSYWLEEGDKR